MTTAASGEKNRLGGGSLGPVRWMVQNHGLQQKQNSGGGGGKAADPEPTRKVLEARDEEENVEMAVR